MNSATVVRELSEPHAVDPQRRMPDALAMQSARLAALLSNLLEGMGGSPNKPDLGAALRFLREWNAHNGAPRAAALKAMDEPTGVEPLDRVIREYSLSPLEVDTLLLAGLPDEHEGFAAVFRTLHPEGSPEATVGLAARLFSEREGDRLKFRELMETGAARATGIIQLSGSSSPFFQRSLRLPQDLWSVLRCVQRWPQGMHARDANVDLDSLQEWLEGSACQQALRLLEQEHQVIILVSADSLDIAASRAAALASRAGLLLVERELPKDAPAEMLPQAQLWSVALGRQLLIKPQATDQPIDLEPLGNQPTPVLICASPHNAIRRATRPLFEVRCDPLSSRQLRGLWARALPEHSSLVPQLAARFPVEPDVAMELALELRLLEVPAEGVLGAIADRLRVRSTRRLSTGVQLIRPNAGWEQLVLREDRQKQLKQVVERLTLQAQVLDDWKFLAGRRGKKGVRVLLSGPPGTGKTLSAEVLAHTLGVDLLLVDVSQLVSKWIGETEKNLAEVFLIAEQTHAVLLFDEADALFAKRTDVSDANDRYANLETAYLLTRIEQYEGLAVLSTNLGRNVDGAFQRRLEFHIPLDPPDTAQRVRLWRCHIPQGVPLADDVNFEQLASHYQIVGALIRNAAVSAAFMAAAEQSLIRQTHFLRAIRNEYQKASKAFPGYPPGCSLD